MENNLSKTSEKTQKNQKISSKSKILRSLLVLFALLCFFSAMYAILVFTGFWERVNSIEKVRSLILSMGFYGRTIFVLLQFLQVTFLPLPASACVIAGTLVYGPFQASLLSLSGILLGSAFAFFLGKTFGKRLVIFMVGKDAQEKWTKFLDNGKYSYLIMMLLPFFPDDVLCLVAGLTSMSWQFFVISQLLTRPIGIFLTAYFSSGTLIPYHGWGLVVWAIILIVAIVLIVLTTKYNEKIENFFKKSFKKAKKREKI